MSAAETAAMLGTSAVTVRTLIATGALAAAKEELGGQRFRWRVEKRSVQAYLSTHGRVDRRREARRKADGRSGPPAASAELRDLRAAVDGLRRELHERRDESGLHAEVVRLRDAILRQRHVADLLLQADVARSEMTDHLLKALAAGDTAHALQRRAVDELSGLLGQLAVPGDASELG